MWIWRRYKQTTVLSWCLAACLLGLIAAGKYSWQVPLLTTLLAGLTGIGLLYRYGRIAPVIAALVVASSMAGILRGALVKGDLYVYKEFYSKQVTVRGTIFDDPSYDKNKRLDFKLVDCIVNGQAVRGVVRIKALGGSFHRGNTVEVQGKLADGFGNYQATLYYVSPKLVNTKDGPIEALRRKFFAAVASSVPDPQASLGLGFVVGLTSYLPDTLQDQLRALALTHVVVASGYNLTILLRIVRRLVAKYSKRLACAGGISFMVLMVALTGASPSVVRAAVVTCLSLAAWYYGRRVHPVVILLLGAVITAAANPLYVWHDLGWWLSFVSFTGVLLLAPLLQRAICGSKEPNMLLQIAIETSAAQLATTPMMMGIFGNLSVLGLVANILVVPFVPIAMAATALAGFVGMFAAELAAWLGLLANWVIRYMVYIINNFGALPWAAIDTHISVTNMGIMYVGLGVVGALIYKRSGHSYANQPNIVE